MISALAKGDVDDRLGAQRPPARLLRLRDLGWSPTSCDRPRPCCAPSACRVGLMPPADRARARRPRGRRPRRAGRARTPLVAPPVHITFLGGLGEIGRNCACIESDGQILLLDCGLMFPDLDMLGHRPRPARLHLPARERRPRRRLHRHPRPRGPRRRAVVPAARAVVPDLRLRAHPRPGPQPHRGGGPARPHRAHPVVADGERRKIGPFDVRVHPRHPLGAPRLRHRLPHPAGHDPAHRRLQARPHPGRRPPHRPRPHGRHRPGRGHPPAPVRLHQRRRARPLPHRRPRSARCSTTCSTSTRAGASIIACFASHIHRVQQIADAAIAFGRKVATLGLSMKKNVRAGPRDGPAAHPRLALVDIEDIDDLPTRRRVRDLHRHPGRADVGADPHGHRREPLAQDRRGRHRHPQLAPDPRQRDERDQGHRRPDAARRRGRALRHRRRARHRPRQAGGAQDPPVDRRARVVRPGPRRVPPPGRPRRAGPPDGRRPPTTCCCARTATSIVLDDKGIAGRARCPPATSTSTASSATSATACCATAGCWPRRAWSSSSSPST